jgi:5-formyltetrahydrofolate cyclo-ligase
MTPAQLRKQLRQQRRALDDDTRRAASLRLAALLARQRVFQAARHIAFYLANDGELDPAPLMEIAWRRRKTVYLPVLETSRVARLLFAPYRPGDALRLNRFGIPEPDTRRLTNGRHLDLVLMPLVGFDEHGNRLGMGGGFYDRSFAYLRHRRYWRQPKLIGLAYELQRVERLEARDWDVPMSMVVTEARIYRPAQPAHP